MPGPVAFVLKGYPRLSESFIAQEIYALEQRGLDIRIVSLRHPTDKARHPVHDEIRAPVRYLPEYLRHEPGRVLRAWQRVRRWPTYRAVRATWLADFFRDTTTNRVRRFGQALVLAAELDDDVTQLHAHFLHTPASVTRYAAMLTGKPWSVSAHAKDVWTTPDWEITEKLGDCRWATTCNEAAHLRLRAAIPTDHRQDHVALLYHGIDLDRFPPSARPHAPRDGADATAPVRLLSVGRAVAKKGYDDLLDALALLPAALQWRLVHIGGGDALKPLRASAARLGLADRIEWRGAQAQQVVLQAYREADVFVLASRIADDGDRDGLPNVLLEAQSQALPVVATDVAGIPELIVHEQTGLLAPQRTPQALADGLQRLIVDASLRQRLGDAGQRRIVEDFAQELWIDRLARKFGLPEPRRNGAEGVAAAQ